MGLKCSMFGHSFGDPEVEREREENGEEVVVTVREVKVCSRCGAESVVSENKEVTSLRQPPSDDDGDDGGAESPDDAATADASADAETPDEAAPNLDAVEDEGAELLGEDDAVFDGEGAAEEHEDADAVEEAEPPSAAATDEDSETDESPAVADEDAAIVDAEADDIADETESEADDGDGAADENPPVADPEDLLPGDAVEEAEPEVDAAEEAEPEDDAAAAPPTDDAADDATTEADDDGVILDEAETEPDPERSRGEWPDSSDVGPPAGDSETDTWPDDAGAAAAETARRESETAETAEDAGAVETGIASAGRAPAADEPTDPGDAELFCPSCSYTASLDRASLRVGDICPECKRGYLSER